MTTIAEELQQCIDSLDVTQVEITYYGIEATIAIIGRGNRVAVNRIGNYLTDPDK